MIYTTPLARIVGLDDCLRRASSLCNWFGLVWFGLPTHHDIVKQCRKGLTAVVDRCVYIYPTIGTTLFRIVLFVAVLVETRAC